MLAVHAFDDARSGLQAGGKQCHDEESNGIFYFDRRPKFDAARLRSILSRPAAYELDPPLALRSPEGAWTVLVGAVPDGDLSRPWRWMAGGTPAAGWTEPGFDDAAWAISRAGFGAKASGDDRIRTPWTGKDLWLRQEFEFGGGPFGSAAPVIRCDETAEVHANGAEVWKGEGWSGTYAALDITAALRKALRPGKNLLAVRFHREEGDRMADLAILISRAASGAPPPPTSRD